ncbi:MAG: hypothetical protein FWD61_04345 [Phycisphaerales bacterium]|nr:hypothetical protein [Phycisphaerales bacterium]
MKNALSSINWAMMPPAWLDVRRPTITVGMPALDKGELAAITLAMELHADRLLIDEQMGRQIAQRNGIAVTGILAVIRDAAVAGLIDIQEVLPRLKRTSFRASLELYAAVFDHLNKSPSI